MKLKEFKTQVNKWTKALDVAIVEKTKTEELLKEVLEEMEQMELSQFNYTLMPDEFDKDRKIMTQERIIQEQEELIDRVKHEAQIEGVNLPSLTKE